MRMGSFKRSVSVVQRDGAVAAQNGEGGSDSSPSPSPSPKSSRARPYVALTGLINSWGNPLDLLTVLERARATFPGVFSQRSSRSGERMKLKGLMPWRRAFFHFLVCFMVGVLGGFTPFVMVDISKDLASEHRAFSFREDTVAGNSHRKIDAIRERTSLVEKQAFSSNHSLGGVARVEMLDKPSIRDSDLVPEKLLIIVTPTYVRPFQAYYLNRLAHTLRVVPPPLIWIVVEVPLQSEETAQILRDTGVMYRHLACDPNVTTVKDISVHQRNVALSHIEKHQLGGIVFFADDDRMFSGSLFYHMRQIRRFGAWPVAVVMESKKKVLIEGPVCNGTQVIGWHTDQKSKLSQRFHADMSGFAFNSTLLWDPMRGRRPTPEPIRQHDTKQHGFQVTSFIEQLVEDESEMEGLLDGCSRIMVWHLHLEAPKLIYPNGWSMQKNLEVVAPLT